MMETETLRREEFEAWLRSLPPGKKVGFPDLSCDCPLARWLRRTKDRSAWVGCIQWGIGITDTRPLPAWAEQFVNAVDETMPREDVYEPEAHPITAACALSILVGICAEESANA